MIAPSSTGIGDCRLRHTLHPMAAGCNCFGSQSAGRYTSTRLVGLAPGGLDQAEFPRAVRLSIRPIRPPPMTEDLPLVAIGQNVGPYRIDALLGWGMGVVYRRQAVRGGGRRDRDGRRGTRRNKHGTPPQARPSWLKRRL